MGEKENKGQREGARLMLALCPDGPQGELSSYPLGRVPWPGSTLKLLKGSLLSLTQLLPGLDLSDTHSFAWKIDKVIKT